MQDFDTSITRDQITRVLCAILIWAFSAENFPRCASWPHFPGRQWDVFLCSQHAKQTVMGSCASRQLLREAWAEWTGLEDEPDKHFLSQLFIKPVQIIFVSDKDNVLFSHHIKKAKASLYSVQAFRNYSCTDSSMTPCHRIYMEMQLLGRWTRNNKHPREILERLLFLVYLEIPTTQTTCPLDKLRLKYF